MERTEAPAHASARGHVFSVDLRLARGRALSQRVRAAPHHRMRFAGLPAAPREDRGITPETPDRAVDAQEEFPYELRSSGDALQRAQRAARMVTAEHDGRPGQDDQRPADEPEPR